MSQEVVEEKMEQLKVWMEQIDEGELYLDAQEYEDYEQGYWDSDWITEYFDNQGIGDKLASVIQFAKDCVDDRWYREANGIYEWLWEMCVDAQSEWQDDCEAVDLETLVENQIVCTDLRQLALLTLYADYQAREAQERAESLYLYFVHSPFRELHMEDMFHVGRENLDGAEQFWRDWIALLKTKNGDTEGRLLKEAVLYSGGIAGLVDMADENCNIHPSLYVSVMDEYDKMHDYDSIEATGKRAMEKVDRELTIRSEIALKAAYAASCLRHTEEMMRFCWESFCSDSTVLNFLRLFGTEEMARQYGKRGSEIFSRGMKSCGYARTMESRELRRNRLGDSQYYALRFFTGDFQAAWKASENPEGSLGWTGNFIRKGIRLFLLYLYEHKRLSKASAELAEDVGFMEDTGRRDVMDFESEIVQESRQKKVSVFWCYFQRWKQYFPMEHSERKRYLDWAEKTARSRADAIVSGQHRRQYQEAAVLLAVVAEVRESMGELGAVQAMYADYKKKFPRHSSFQADMKKYFGM